MTETLISVNDCSHTKFLGNGHIELPQVTKMKHENCEEMKLGRVVVSSIELE